MHCNDLDYFQERMYVLCYINDDHKKILRVYTYNYLQNVIEDAHEFEGVKMINPKIKILHNK